MGRYLPDHPSSQGGHVTLAHPAGPEEDGGTKRSGHDGVDVICMSERKVPVVEMSQRQSKAISPPGL